VLVLVTSGTTIASDVGASASTDDDGEEEETPSWRLTKVEAIERPRAPSEDDGADAGVLEIDLASSAKMAEATSGAEGRVMASREKMLLSASVPPTSVLVPAIWVRLPPVELRMRSIERMTGLIRMRPKPHAKLAVNAS